MKPINHFLEVGLSPEGRAITLALELAAGAEVHPREIAQRFQVSRQTGYRILDRLAGVMPICPDDRGVWRLVDYTGDGSTAGAGRSGDGNR